MSEHEELAEHVQSLYDEHREQRADDPTRDPAGSRHSRPVRPLPSLLTSLSHVMTEDAHADLLRISPARWRLRVHQHDPEGWAVAVAEGTVPDKGEDDELAEYTCVMRSMPVAHCQPDVLTWLQDREITGAVVLEWLPPTDKRASIMRHFVHIPNSHQQKSREAPVPLMKPDGTRGMPDVMDRVFSQLQHESAALRDMVREMQQSQERIINHLSTEQRNTIDDVRKVYLDQFNNDPLRKVGHSVYEASFERMKRQLQDERKNPLESLVDQFKELEVMRQKLGALVDPEVRERVNPLEEKIGNALTDLAVMWGKQKLGLPAVSSDQALDLTRKLAELNSEGASLLDALNDDAA